MNSEEPVAARARLLAQVEEAARVIAPLWPLSTFIAVNPLWDLRHMPFDHAVVYANQVLGINGYPSTELLYQAYVSGRLTDADLRAALDGDPAGAGPRYGDGGQGGASRLGGAQVWTDVERDDVVVGTQIAVTVDREVAKWCAAYLAGILPDNGARGFYAAWQEVVVCDPAARSLIGRAGRKRLADLGADPEDAILACLELLGITEETRVLEFARHLARMPGWAGHAKWRSLWADPDHVGPALHLLDLLAVRLCYAATLLRAPARRALRKRNLSWSPLSGGSEGPKDFSTDDETWPVRLSVAGELDKEVGTRLSQLTATEAARVWLAAYEGHYRDWLLATLNRRVETSSVRPEVQAVFCIDVRSEGLRRHLENGGLYETSGFAGFFALPIRFHPWGSDQTLDLCPVLIRPSTELGERPAVTSIRAAGRQLTGRQALAAAQSAFDGAKKGTLSSFALAEAGGFLAGPVAALRTLAPTGYQALRAWAHRIVTPPIDTIVDVDPAVGAMSDADQALFAQTALSTMGLTRDFAPVVLLCGHASTTENNPYASSLDCGACGGNRGGASARSAAAILNRKATRRLLVERGIFIPDETLFVAGEHDTTTDTVTVFDMHLVPSSHLDRVVALQSDLDRAGSELASERALSLPGVGGQGHAPHSRERAADWAQVRPEWGLARNAAFIVAPRALTASVDLGSRCFLHSYDAGLDPDGIVLETILTAPMVVAHWINAQYYFSTVDPNVLSAGDKTAHNIVAGIGVLQGADGDLRVGLPLQSLFDGETTYHEPMRLLTVVQAPHALLESVIARNPVLRELFDGQWVHLAARDGDSDCWKIRHPDGTWVTWIPAEAPIKAATTRG